MKYFHWLQTIFLKPKWDDKDHWILPLERQIEAWQRANRKLSWGIRREDFERIQDPPKLSENDREQGFLGTALFYGFSDDGFGHADSVLSGKVAWDFARKHKRIKTWQCEYIDFDRSEDIRLRPGAPARPKHFYYAKFNPGENFQSFKVAQVRKNFRRDTGCGPEGIQFLAITHSHFLDMMNDRKIPFMALADYDVAPYGYNDFFDAPQIFCSNGIMGLGIGNVDRNYPLFGIPIIRF